MEFGVHGKASPTAAAPTMKHGERAGVLDENKSYMS